MLKLKLKFTVIKTIIPQYNSRRVVGKLVSVSMSESKVNQSLENTAKQL